MRRSSSACSRSGRFDVAVVLPGESHVITVVPALAGDEGDNIVGSGEPLIVTPPTLGDIVPKLPAVEPEAMRAVSAAIQRVTTINFLRRRSSVARPDSRGGVCRATSRRRSRI